MIPDPWETAAQLRRAVRWAVALTFVFVAVFAGVAWLAVVHCSPA